MAQYDTPHGRRPRGDAPRRPQQHDTYGYGEHPYGEQSYGERPYGERPHAERSYGEHPHGDRPRAAYGRDGRPTASRHDAYAYEGYTHDQRPHAARPHRGPRTQAGDPHYRDRAQAGDPRYHDQPHATRSDASHAQAGRPVSSTRPHARGNVSYGRRPATPRRGVARGGSRSGLESSRLQLPQLATGMAPRGSGGNAPTIIVGIVVVAAIVIVGILMWSNRSVNITLDGKATTIRVGSTIDQVISEKQLSPTSGNLISVSGNKLEDGSGYPYLFKLAGNEQDGTATAAYRVADGDDISIEDGRDRTEDYDVQVVEEQPKLEMGGDAWGNLSYISQWPKVGSYEMRTGKQSGETARGDTLQDTQNAVVSIHQIKPTDGRKLVALTFDDGPAEKYTEAYLDILNKYGIHATFFNLGQNIKEYPDLAKKIVDQGSEVMSHTYQHQQLSTLDATALQQEFSNTFSMIEDTVGVKTTSFRPPYGDFKESTWLNSGGLATVSVLWNQDSLDWKRPGVDAIVTNATKSITSGSIILMHDGGGPRDQDVEALPKIIEQLQGQGYEFVTVTELMQSDEAIPSDIAGGDATMPDDSVWPTELAEKDTSTKTTS